MTITEKAQKYSNMFESKTRENGTRFVVLKDNRDQKLHDSVYKAHGDRLPDDWIFGTYADLMEKVTEYTLNTIEDLEEVRHEIVDSYIDIYTHDLTKWLSEDINNVNYLTQALEEFGSFEDGYKLLATAQYLAIDEVFSYIYGLLSD